MTRFRVGTSGFSYPAWKGSFYPADLPARRFLAYYAEHFAAVEINATFYRMPKREQLLKWRAEVPPSFVFVLKAPQRITHQKRLADVGDDVRYFVDTAGALGAQCGPLLFQLPPHLHKDVERLGALLEIVPKEQPIALEFRHPSWHDEEVHELMRAHAAALCCADTDDVAEAAPLIATAPWAYVRLRRLAYDAAALEGWVQRFGGFGEAFVFFKHEEAGSGPRFAADFLAAARR
jgi:uncharacterized protein YecE (DUF72 family)